MNRTLQDLRYALRQLRNKPAFSLMAVLTLALGIGASTAIFSLMNAVMLRMLPVEKPQELVLLGDGASMGISGGFPSGETTLFSYPFYRDFQKKNEVFSGVAAIQSLPNDTFGFVDGNSANEPVNARLVSGTYFSVLGVNPLRGRVLSDADDQTAGAHPVAVASYAWWDRRFNRDPGIVGKQVVLSGVPYSIIGVAPRDFSGTTVGESPDLWVPLAMQAQLQPGSNGLADRMYQALYLIGRLKPGVDRVQAGANTTIVFKQILHDYAGPNPDQEHLDDIQHAQITLTSMATGLSRLRFKVGLPLQILMGVVVLVLLIACANLATMLLARASAREREVAVRMAMGARRSRLIRQLLCESLVLSLFGGAMGVLFAWWASHALVKMVAAGLGPLYLDLGLDLYVLAFAVTVSTATAFLFGLAPAFRATRVDLVSSLKEGKGAKLFAGRNLAGRALVVSQVALSLVLLVGASLLLRTLVNLGNVDPGFDKDNTLFLRLDPSTAGYAARSAGINNLYRQIEQRIEAVPGVSAASFTMIGFNEGAWTSLASAPGYVPRSPNDAFIHNNLAGPDYFSAMGIPLLQGRVLGAQDTENSPRVAVINQTMAQRFFGNDSPIGKHFNFGNPAQPFSLEVIGVVANAKMVTLDEPPFSTAYLPYTQYRDYGGGSGFLYALVVRYSGNAESIANEVRQAIAGVNRNVAVSEVTSLAQQASDSMAPQSLIARLSSFFGLFAVFLACLGIYGLLAYAVSQRTKEIGIRLALGARLSNLRWLVAREALLLVSIGLAVGIPAALAGTRIVGSLLFGVAPSDLVSLFAAVGLTLAVAAMAAYIPARRAAKVDPMVALRYE